MLGLLRRPVEVYELLSVVYLLELVEEAKQIIVTFRSSSPNTYVAVQYTEHSELY